MDLAQHNVPMTIAQMEGLKNLLTHYYKDLAGNPVLDAEAYIKVLDEAIAKAEATERAVAEAIDLS
jgi:hypothetical protein